MIKFIKNLFSPAQPQERMVPIKEEKEYIYMGDGMIEEVVRRGDPFPKANPGPGAKVLKAEELKRATTLSKVRNQNPNRTGAAPTATHYDRSYTDNTHMSMIAPVTVLHSTPSYTPSTSGGYDPGYSSCDSGSSGGSCD
ncbi:hypothetical protein PP425_gp026 [Enterobacter phage vB_EclM_Q7622]|uniref:hypothetical protein n=1 Tax=Enterobacter phage vB_EclM_Q7622 TaxID=2908628 RepID=UPI002329923E|nr:hypothetical protein PP425_gp026 [Enterobacter phage vB_EclM_Q7622]UIS65541.1 hypothetical protein Q76222_00026 [Enterobacter phage vB_EclM_Q7622]